MSQKDTKEQLDQPTNQDILETINQFATDITVEIHDFKTDTHERFDRLESAMVTKDYLDDKLFDLRGDLTTLIRKEDDQVTALVDTLEDKKVLSAKEASRILAFKPLARKA